jgi:hypothetical protein
LYFNVCARKKLLTIYYCDLGLGGGGGGSSLYGGFVQLQGNKNSISGTAQTSMFGVVVN